MTGMWRPRRSRSEAPAESWSRIAIILQVELVDRRMLAAAFVGILLVLPVFLRPDQEFLEVAGKDGFLGETDVLAKVLRKEDPTLAVEHELLRRMKVEALERADGVLELTALANAALEL